MSRVTGKFSYNAICDVCGFKFKNTELRKRWDGFMVCKDDYETRHILDFYSPKNDSHTLPWTRPDNQDETSWTPTVTDLTTAGTGTTTVIATYQDNGTEVSYTIQITNTGDNTSASVLNTTTLTLPTATATASGGGTAIDENGTLLGLVSVDTGTLTIRPPTWGAWEPNIVIKGRYTK
jgi:hypothetical protein